MIERKIASKSIFDSPFLVALILFLFIKPAYFSQIYSIGKIYKYSEILITLLTFVYSLFYKKKTFSTIWYYLFFGIILLSTILNKGSIYNFFNSILPTFGLCVFFDTCLEKNPKTLFKAFTALEIYIYINFLTILLFPNGMYKGGVYYENWFLGYKNIQIRTVLPIVCMSIINSYICFNKLNMRTKILIFVTIFTLILIKSSTAIVGFAIFLALFFKYHDKKPIPKILNLRFSILITSILFYIISVLKLQNIFEFFIVDVLHKDLTFSGRIQLWDSAIELIKAKPITGYGYLTGENFQMMFNSVFYTHTHNYFLYILITGGLVLFAVLIIGLLYANKSISNSNNSIYSRVILFTLISFLVMGMTESITSTVLLYPMIILGMHSHKISNL